MMPLLDELKEYLRIDGDDEVQSISTILQTAILILENAGVKQPSNYYLIVNDKDVFAEHRLAILTLATHLYENRTVITNQKNELPYGLQTMILQLKWVDPDELSAQQ
ncbi:head-tail connector protein [Lysinibacillus sp. KU-BSD001]|uniref:head-tail connector protein n=1 Tax=Lysinibacillus sp. KU-BSD001 TaxID=3141328 RepID=UPI0036EB69C1